MTKTIKNQIFLILSFLMIGGLISSFLKYELISDFLLYHYYNGFSFVHSRYDTDLSVAFLGTYYNPVLDSLSYLLIHFCGDNLNLFYFITGLPFGMLLFFSYKISSLYFDPASLKGKAQIIAVLLIAATGFGVNSVIGTISHDIEVSALVLGAFYLLLRKKQAFFLSGFLLGTAAALKLTASIYCISGGLFMLLMRRKSPHPVKDNLLFILGGFSGFILFNGFWMYILWKNYQNPFFPFLNAIFKSPYYPEINYIDKLASAKASVTDMFLLPFILTAHTSLSEKIVNCDVADGRLAFLFIIAIVFIPFSFITKKALSDAMKRFCILTLLSYLVWIFISVNIRFLIPVEIFSSIIIVSVFSAIKYPHGVISEGIYWSALILGLFYLCSTPHYSAHWGKRTDFPLLNETITLPENTLIINYGDSSSAFVAQLIEKNPSAKAIGIHSEHGWKKWNMSGYGEMKKKADEMMQSHTNQVVFVHEPYLASFLPPVNERYPRLKGWLCEEVSLTQSYASLDIYKICFPPEMKEKIVIERKDPFTKKSD